MRVLQIGDVVYKVIKGKIVERLEINRVTKTMAVCLSMRFYREYTEKGMVIAVNRQKKVREGKIEDWHGYYYIENEKLREEWERHELIVKLRHFKYDKLQTPELKSLHKILVKIVNE